MYEINLSGLGQTEALAQDCARLLPRGVVLCLQGDLGAGKSVFARAFIRALKADPAYPVTSPTFNLVQTHETPEGPVYHYDLYRIDAPESLMELGFEETPRARASLIEWPERLTGGQVNPHCLVTLNFTITGLQTRRVQITFGEGLPLPASAFVFSAGLGQRMRPLTDHRPKPLVPVAGRPVLDYTFDSLEESGVRRVFMNTHYLADQIDSFAARRRAGFAQVDLFHEEVLLETGGGLKRVLPAISEDIFFVLNGDALLVDSPGVIPYLRRLALAFNPDRMDLLLLLQDVAGPTVTPLAGDYTIQLDGRLIRSRDQTGTHMFTGARILHRRIFEDSPDGRFSFLQLMDRAESQGRLFGLAHQGLFHHLSTPQDVAAVDRWIEGLSYRGGQGSAG